MRWLRAFGAFWYDFVIGDDWRMAASAVGVLAVGGLALLVGLEGPWLPPAIGVGLLVAFVLGTYRSVGHGRPSGDAARARSAAADQGAAAGVASTVIGQADPDVASLLPRT